MDSVKADEGSIAGRLVILCWEETELVRAFFEAIPANCEAAFFLPALSETALAQLAETRLPLPVTIAESGAPVLPSHAYLPPSGKYLAIENGRARVDSPPASGHPVEHVLRSLPTDRHGQTAVVCRRDASDLERTLAGVIERAGGLVFATPRFGAGADKADSEPEAIAQAIENWANGKPAAGSEALMAILDLVRSHSGADLRAYKLPPLQRRIARRMDIARIEEPAGYLKLLETDVNELACLAEDLLIGVTAFFRDTEAFALLEATVVPVICGEVGADRPVRCWVAGCSTGEEAYSIAILLTEGFERIGQRPRLQIFATDVDAEALDFARQGLYSEAALAGISKTRLERHFIREGEAYRIAKQIRESIVFAPHNLIGDPPFSRLDLVVCRNVLIYLNAKIQEKLLESFHFILNPGGHLFLGSSESLGEAARLFDEISKPWRIFRRNDAAAAVRPSLPPFAPATTARLAEGRILTAFPGTHEFQERLYRGLIERHAATLIVANDRHEVLYISGNTQPYLELPSGEPSLDLFKLVKSPLRAMLRSSLDLCRREQRKVAAVVAGSGHAFPLPEAVRITVTPLADDQVSDLFLIGLEAEAPADPVATTATRSGDDGWLLQQLEQELAATREDLRRTIEKSRHTHDELRASNEEIMAMNEELQSANEELESAREELQSLNAELTATNAMLDAKVVELEATSNDLNNLLVATDLAILFLDRNLNIRRYTPACNRLMHLIPSDIGRPFGDIVHHFEDGELFHDAADVLKGEGPKSREILDRQGAWYLRKILPYRSRDNCCVEGLVITFDEVTSLKQAEQELIAQAAELRQQAELLKHAHVLARDLDDRIVFWNSYAEKFYGWSRDEALGRTSHELLNSRFPLPLATIRQQLLADGHWKGELIHVDRQGRERTVATHWELYRDAEGTPRAIVEVNNDITERNSFEAQLRQSRHYLDYLAYYDPLTQLPNRLRFQQRLEQAVAQALVAGKRLGLLFLDVDRFKLINDSLGHDVGDNLLLEVSRRLEERLGPADTLARIGGDEFAVLMEDLDDISYPSRFALAAIEAVKTPVVLDHHELFVSLSGGISLFPEDSRDADGLLRSADAAMFLAKEKGRGNYEFFTPDLNRRANRLLSIETRLRKALENGELELAFQPQMNLQSGTLSGAEALARWNSHELGRVPTDEFIQVAEDSGLIVPLGEWVIQTVCQRLAEWLRSGLKPVRIAVNISARQFREPNFVRLIADSLAETAVDPALLELELTERLLLQDVDTVVRTLLELKRTGVSFSMDDFGTGYSSLSYLRRLPLSHLKVAREFIPWGADDCNNLSISRAIVSLAKSLELTCTVEGIETQAQLNCFKTLGCDQAQGYLISPPLPAGKFEDFLRDPLPFKL
ncbi:MULTISPECIES: EAL domain-containing protein [Methylococcus]|uniref:EAL domain-containing protein n=1 Tax=Methylococcus capsulatus TaxID=414 RepID=A0ABZ2F3K4_METCP|nr:MULTISPECIES: EAL domain-containing protein [Methylococcus]MDF9391909.1 EAL domain-containing protein [Methylococcus capsulatus]